MRQDIPHKTNGIADYKDQVRKKAARYEEVFSTPAGKEVLADLRLMHVDIELFDKDPIEMAGRVAARDVVVRILNLMRVAQNDGSDE